MTAPKTSERDILASLRPHGWVKKETDAPIYKHGRMMYRGKRPFDISATINGQGLAIEVKSSATYSLQFLSLTYDHTTHEPTDTWRFVQGQPDEWPEELREGIQPSIQWHQRRGLSRFEVLGKGKSWLAIQFGRNAVNAVEKPRRMFMIPWDRWLHLEKAILDLGYTSIGLTSRYIAVREQGLTVLHELADCELTWQGGKAPWTFSKTHPFYQMYLNNPLQEAWTELYNLHRTTEA